MKWICQQHKIEVYGKPFFIREGDQWEIDLSDMYCLFEDCVADWEEV